MPTYEYRCKRCGFHFEEFQSIVSEPIAICPPAGWAGPRCRGQVQRIINGGIGLIFRGNGFYITDYKRSGHSDGKPSSEKTETKAKEE